MNVNLMLIKSYEATPITKSLKIDCISGKLSNILDVCTHGAVWEQTTIKTKNVLQGTYTAISYEINEALKWSKNE